jgi:Mg/Co/Ni transporter MgtE
MRRHERSTQGGPYSPRPRGRTLYAVGALMVVVICLVELLVDREGARKIPETDRAEVARVVAKYDLVSVPVVDARHRLLGTITVDDVLDLGGEEACEDIFRIAGSDASELERRSPRQVPLMRLPWILATLLIEMVAGLVIHYFDESWAR